MDGQNVVRGCRCGVVNSLYRVRSGIPTIDVVGDLKWFSGQTDEWMQSYPRLFPTNNNRFGPTQDDNEAEEGEESVSEIQLRRNNNLNSKNPKQDEIFY